MDRRTFLEALGTGTASLALGPKGAGQVSERRPNVLAILPDEWRAQALGCMGNPDVHTPNIDRLASEGMLLRNALANSPVCCPARANILTGTYASRNGMIANDLRLRESEITLGELFSGAGYRTGYIGKWHLDGGPRVPGFVPPGPRRHGFQFWAANECWHNYFYGWYFRDENVPIMMTKYEPEAWTDIAIEFLYENQDQKQPFFLMLAPGVPHDPYVVPEYYSKMYDSGALSMRANWVEGTNGGGRKEIAAYYAAITAIDEQIGRVIKALRVLGMEEDTILVFTSDHGDMLGSQGAILKRKPWEESIRVPGIIRYPGKVGVGRKDGCTLLARGPLANIAFSVWHPYSRPYSGHRLGWRVLGKEKSGPDSAYFQIFGPYHGDGLARAWRGVRTDRYMYARWESGPWVLYDRKGPL